MSKDKLVGIPVDSGKVVDTVITPCTLGDGKEYYEVHSVYEDGTKASIGTTDDYESARIMRAKHDLGIPNAVETSWIVNSECVAIPNGESNWGENMRADEPTTEEGW